MTKYLSGILIVIIAVAFSCRKVDDTPPIINMNPPDSIYHVLNELYADPGATATDEADQIKKCLKILLVMCIISHLNNFITRIIH